MRTTSVGVFRIATKGPGDVSGLMSLIASGKIDPKSILAILGKTEGNGGVNDFTRILADQAFRRVLQKHGHRSEALHGGMEQRQRDRVMGLFRSKKAEVLIATDVAARGLDIEHLSHVVNYDVPASPDAYLHRIGRTGRAGRGGTAITLAEPREHRLLRAIESFTRAKIDVGTVPTVADLRARCGRCPRRAQHPPCVPASPRERIGRAEATCATAGCARSRP